MTRSASKRCNQIFSEWGFGLLLKPKVKSFYDSPIIKDAIGSSEVPMNDTVVEKVQWNIKVFQNDAIGIIGAIGT